MTQAWEHVAHSRMRHLGPGVAASPLTEIPAFVQRFVHSAADLRGDVEKDRRRQELQILKEEESHEKAQGKHDGSNTRLPLLAELALLYSTLSMRG